MVINVAKIHLHKYEVDFVYIQMICKKAIINFVVGKMCAFIKA